MNLKNLRILGLAIAGGLLLPQSTIADEQSCTSLAACNAGISSQINFKVVVPAFIRFRLGDPAAGAATLEYTLAAADLGSGASVNSTLSTNHGTGTAGDVAVAILSNVTSGTNVSFTADTATLTGGFGQTTGTSANKPAWDEMTVTTTNIAHPVSNINGSSAAAVNLGLATAAIYNQTDTWTFTYDNSRLLPEGTYQGSVVYTLTAF